MVDSASICFRKSESSRSASSSRVGGLEDSVGGIASCADWDSETSSFFGAGGGGLTAEGFESDHSQPILCFGYVVEAER